ncbi:TetR family transcriptional regulator [Brevibacillus parabrevis]|uniref:TetR/AcrR family transcriptional regulator n=1 Tax=Brevibacillus parabrevis TaxID=54914 RepID=UPI0007AB7455|nr:TetR/AcrR family transcriptional regulator [Brevibacillus parabrevis]KZE52506.1 TetR family transcriptional regulator [Brevibacillus parabrevis]
MPRSKEQNEEIRAQRKEAIMQGALAVYVEKGYAAADIKDVAEHAGVARGLVYYYYKDKRSLFRDLFAHMFQLSNKHTRYHFSQEGTAVELCERFALVMFHNLFERSLHVMFFFRMRHDLRELFTGEELRGLMWRDNNLQVMIDALRQGMEAGDVRQMSPELLAEQFWGAMMHAMGYLHRKKKGLRADGHDMEQIKALLTAEIEAATESCVSMLRPQPRM